MVEVLAGTFATSAAFLSIMVACYAVHMMRLVHGEARLKPWKILLIALFLFTIEEVLGALKYFDIYKHPFLTHIIPSFILGLIIYALVLEIIIVKTQ
tara:strand:- start:10277 stop:10567 length:291 start_codon:yes stop_codon:yes gene_type:complete